MITGQVIGQLTATNNPTSWAITGGTASANFSLSNSGVLTATSTGTTNMTGLTGTTSITVTATGTGGTSQTQTITINYAPQSGQNQLIGINNTNTYCKVGNSIFWYPNFNELAYMAAIGVHVLRLQASWEMCQGTLGGVLSLGYINSMKSVMQMAGSLGMSCIFDIHNFGTYDLNHSTDGWSNPQSAGTGGWQGSVFFGDARLTSANFNDLWTKLTGTLTGSPGLGWYEIMNEPHDLVGGSSTWATYAQGAINAIRAIDTTTPIIVDGYAYSAGNIYNSQNPSLWNLTGGSLIFTEHWYFDGAGGVYTTPYATINPQNNPCKGVADIQSFANNFCSHGVTPSHTENGIPTIGETGHDPGWDAELKNFMAYCLGLTPTTAGCAGGTGSAGVAASGIYCYFDWNGYVAMSLCGSGSGGIPTAASDPTQATYIFNNYLPIIQSATKNTGTASITLVGSATPSCSGGFSGSQGTFHQGTGPQPIASRTITVNIYDSLSGGTAAIGTTTTNNATSATPGSWSFTTGALSSGTHSFTCVCTKNDGAATSTSAAFNVTMP